MIFFHHRHVCIVIVNISIVSFRHYCISFSWREAGVDAPNRNVKIRNIVVSSYLLQFFMAKAGDDAPKGV